MYLYEVWVSSFRFHGDSTLTYKSDDRLTKGSIVEIPLRGRQVLGFIEGTSKLKNQPKNIKSITSVIKNYLLPQELVSLHKWIMEYYISVPGTTTQLLLPSYLGVKSFAIKSVDKAEKTTMRTKLPRLTQDQSLVISKIKGSKPPFTYLLHGVTGSGKTRVYGEIIAETLAKGKSAILLTPEIGLTAQVGQDIEPFAFGYKVLKIHSKMSPAQRRNAWLNVFRAVGPLLVVGPRSALFMPIHNLGLIIVDEEHDGSYKQSQSPYYHAVRVASVLSKLHDARLILGSATPSIGDYYLAISRKNSLLTMPNLAIASKFSEPTVNIIDLKDKSQFTRSNILSNSLLAALNSSLSNHTQSLLFLNRRGTARVVACKNCDWQAICPNCSLPVTYHHTNNTLRCHTCGWISTVPTSCPICRSVDILLRVPGTKAVEQEVNRLFPAARVARFDSDNVTSEQLSAHVKAIKKRDIDIIIGTQILIKGFDIPNLSTVGLVNADTSLAFPDFSAAEKTFQLITQAIGRVGRGHTEATIIVQTHTPHSLLLKTAVEKDWQSFYTHELESRRTQNLPPFSHVLKLICVRGTNQSAEKAVSDYASVIANKYTGVSLLGPAPAFRGTHLGKSVWQLIVLAKKRSLLTSIIRDLPSGWRYDIDPLDLL